MHCTSSQDRLTNTLDGYSKSQKPVVATTPRAFLLFAAFIESARLRTYLRCTLSHDGGDGYEAGDGGGFQPQSRQAARTPLRTADGYILKVHRGGRAATVLTARRGNI